MVATGTCLDEMAVAHGEGDEVWECDSEVESGTDAESEQDSDAEVPLPLPGSPVAAQAKKVSFSQGYPQQQKMPLQPAVPARTVQAPPKMALAPVQAPPKMAPAPVVEIRQKQIPSLQSQAQTSAPWMKGATELALHLRKDNERLRQLLVEAQREAENAIEQGQSKGDVDFAHLLELVKEFGSTGIGENTEPNKGDEPEVCMSFNTQEFRMDEDDVDDKDLEIKRLNAEIAEAKEKLASQQSGIKPCLTKIDEASSIELVGYWVSSKTGDLQHVVRADTDTDLDAPNAVEWEIIEADQESVTLQSDSGIEHCVERLKTKMFGESLLWGSGDLWTRKADA